jgi:hypothetical protein
VLDASHGHAMGIISWSADRFVTLRAWTNAKRIEACSGYRKQEQKIEGATAKGGIQGDTIIATFTSLVQCRNKLVDSRGREFHTHAPWTPCPGPLKSAPVRLVFPDSQTVPATTDPDGRVTFDLASVHWTDDAVKSGQAQFAIADGPPIASVPLAALPPYIVWQQRKREEEDRARQAQEVSAKIARDRQALVDLTTDISSSEQQVDELLRVPDPWGEQQVPLLQRLGDTSQDATRASRILDADQPVDEATNARYRMLVPRALAVKKKIDLIGPRVDRAIAVGKKQQQAQDAAAMALLQAMFAGGGRGGGGGRASAPDTSDERLRQMEAQHQRERAEDESRHQQERAEDDQRRQRERDDAERQRKESERTRWEQEQRCKVACDNANNNAGTIHNQGNSGATRECQAGCEARWGAR